VDRDLVVLPQPADYYIRYSPPDDDKTIEYELDAEDEDWIDSLDEEDDVPVGLTAEFAEVAIDRLEKALAAGRDIPNDASPRDPSPRDASPRDPSARDAAWPTSPTEESIPETLSDEEALATIEIAATVVGRIGRRCAYILAPAPPQHCAIYFMSDAMFCSPSREAVETVQEYWVGKRQAIIQKRVGCIYTRVAVDVKALADIGSMPFAQVDEAAAKYEKTMQKIDPHVGGSYTREQFIAAYGGTAEWDSAEPAKPPPSFTRRMSLIRRLQVHNPSLGSIVFVELTVGCTCQPQPEYDDPDSKTLFRPHWYTR
jgi:hypothetical protein